VVQQLLHDLQKSFLSFKDERKSLMLLLTRKCGEEIIIDGNIRVRVLDTTGSRVRLAIAAPQDIKIVRGELDFKSECPTDAVASEREVAHAA
jgi:carbon storage regulator